MLLQGGIEITPEDCLISYLPLAHIYERLAQVRKRYIDDITRRREDMNFIFEW